MYLFYPKYMLDLTNSSLIQGLVKQITKTICDYHTTLEFYNGPKPSVCNVPVEAIVERLANILVQVERENQDDNSTCEVEIREDLERMTLGFSLLEELDLSEAWKESTPTVSSQKQ